MTSISKKNSSVNFKLNLENVFCYDILTECLIYIPNAVDINEAARILIDNNISGAPVIDEIGTAIGVVSVTDIVRYKSKEPDKVDFQLNYYKSSNTFEPVELLDGFQFEIHDHTNVTEIMTPLVISVNAQDSIYKAIHVMSSKKIHRVLVECEGKIVGIIGTMDIITALGRTMKIENA